MVRLSARILTRPLIPAFTGRIEVDITAEDLPSGDYRQNAEFGKCHLIPPLCIYYNNVCLVGCSPFCIVICPV